MDNQNNKFKTGDCVIAIKDYHYLRRTHIYKIIETQTEPRTKLTKYVLKGITHELPHEKLDFYEIWAERNLIKLGDSRTCDILYGKTKT